MYLREEAAITSLGSTFEVVQGRLILPCDNPYAIVGQCLRKNK